MMLAERDPLKKRCASARLRGEAGRLEVLVRRCVSIMATLHASNGALHKCQYGHD